MSIGPSKLSVVPHVEQNLPCLGHLKKLLDCKTVRIVPPEHVIFYQGESPHTVCLICDGLVKLTRTESDGKPVIVGLRHKGWLLGVGALLPERPYASTAETVTRSKLCYIPTGKLIRVMETHAPFSSWIATIYGREVYSSMINISERSCLSGRQRLENFLWEMVQTQNCYKTDEGIKVTISLKNWEIAQLLSLTPQHLCRLVKDLENKGIILRKNGWLILPEPKILWHQNKI